MENKWIRLLYSLRASTCFGLEHDADDDDDDTHRYLRDQDTPSDNILGKFAVAQAGQELVKR